MTPAQWVQVLLLVVALIYAGTAGAYWFTGRPGMFMVFVGYVISNIGFIWDAARG